VDEFSAVFAAESSLEFTLPPGELDRIFVETKPRAPHPVTALRAAQEPGDEPIEVLDGLTRDAPYSTLARPARRFLALWLAAAIVLALLLAAQIVSNNQDRLGPSVRALYAALGSPLPAPANLAAYQLRQWGVTGDPDANGTLRLRASILNTTPQFQPFPLLRVTLADRFGGRIGTRDFEPAEYLGKPTARQLTPGERVDATLEILDPGKNAEGFEIDVCLRGADRRMACASDVPSQVKR
jgi:hypothetical protein